MNGPLFLFLAALLCIGGTYVPLPWRLLLIPVAVALSAWYLWSVRRLLRGAQVLWHNQQFRASTRAVSRGPSGGRS